MSMKNRQIEGDSSVADPNLLTPVTNRCARDAVRAEVLRAPLRCHRLRCVQRSFHVGMISVVTMHSIGDVIVAPSDFNAKVSSLSSVSLQQCRRPCRSHLG